jgi:putative FmdB family regulatory protein
VPAPVREPPKRPSELWKVNPLERPPTGAYFLTERMLSKSPRGSLDATGSDQTRRVEMPRYDYECQKCGHTFERVERISEHGEKKPRCPKCRSPRVEQSFGNVFVKTGKKS